MACQNKVKLGIFSSADDHTALREPSWLVRRAIGTVLSRIDDVQPAKMPVLHELLSSRNWMHICTGLVAARNVVNEPSISAHLKVLLSGRAPMDVTWLAHLYLADHSKNGLVHALASPLGQTSWGVIDLWKRYGAPGEDKEGALRIIRDSLQDRPDVLRDLRVHLDCLGATEAEMLGVPPDPELAGNDLVKFQYSRQPRGVLPQTPVKWLVSSLYGSWRDQLSGELSDYLENTDGKQILDDIKVCRRMPSVEHRVSLCQDLAASTIDDSRIIDAVEWALSDPHPWVRRESLKLFPGRAAAALAVGVAAERNLYPGYFDLLLESHRNNADIRPYLRGLTIGDRSAVEWATAVER